MSLTSDRLDSLGNDLLIRCASYLDIDGLVYLGRTCARFGLSQPGHRRSLVDEVSHQRFRQSVTDEERKCLTKYDDESDIGLYRALESLRKPLCFDELVGHTFGPQEHPATVRVHDQIGVYFTATGRNMMRGNGWSTAISGHVMRGGRHFAEFTITSGDENFVNLGVIRPVSYGIVLKANRGRIVTPMSVSSSYKPAVAGGLRSQRTVKWGDSNVHCCTYRCHNGYCHRADWSNEMGNSDWQGRERLRGSGTIGLLLDLGEGTLSVFKNGLRLGGVMREGLGGEYCWFVSIHSVCTISIARSAAPD
ncbi:hypothetical protein THAOC_33901 [Thalassiosira oceanica]|uniref:B30.2/SPRY domain-containing protein n=1 Tax=Thalassiosira oceanica TaxID=159749 RepID=K0R4C9_THAOC|nr:hypothetical protein THAOC_33901 [Thalassiosira oceanica]|eukprot:EJK47380.1 hypothetical protein THAOC_33901 [Thalassiosira oceanica]